jgi:diguanylate cyclase (GGDEF)-like protein
MDNVYSRFNVFLITDGLESFLEKSSIPSIDYNFTCLSLDGLELVVSTIDGENKKQNINLIVIHTDCVSNDTVSEINELFVEKCGLCKPNFLFVSTVSISSRELETISNAQNYFYLLPSDEACIHLDVVLYNLLLTVKFIYYKIVNIERLNDYIMSSFQTIVDSAIITKQKNEIESLNEELYAMSRMDFLTKVLNRRAFFEKLEEEKKRSIRDNWRIVNAKAESEKIDAGELVDTNANRAGDQKSEPVGMLLEHFGRFACVMIDIDHFKMVNDTYGHLKGDDVLKTLGEAMSAKNIFRENDVVARYGGEEFIILLPGTSAHNARIPAERFREYIKSIVFYDDAGKEFHITISLGVSEFRPTDEVNEEMINRADQALYFAKENGRDRTVIFDDL